MCSFRDRTQELADNIELYRAYSDPAKYEILSKHNETLSQDFDVVKNYIKHSIEAFSNDLIDALLKSNQIDAAFMSKVFEYNEKFFEETFQGAIENVYPNKKEDVLRAIGCLKTFTQAIIGYEGIFKSIFSKGNIAFKENINELYDLSQALCEMRMMSMFNDISLNNKVRMWNMSKFLPLYCGNLTEVTIISLVNGCNWNLTEDNTLVCGGDHSSWKISKVNDQNYFEFSTSDGLVLSVQGEANSVKCCERANALTKWTIEFCDEKDKTKGYTIKLAGRDKYLCVEPIMNFKTLISLQSKGDTYNSFRFTWMFQSTFKP